MQRRDLYEQAVEEMTRVRMNQHNLSSSISAGLNENFENDSRTKRALERVIQGDEDRAIFSMKDNYNKNIEQLNYQTGLTITDITNNISNMQLPNNKSTAWQTIFGILGVAADAQNREKMLSVQGYKTDIWGKIVKDN